MSHRRAAGLRPALAAVLCLLLSPALGQPADEARRATPGRFDFYVLALSWSPGFCALEGNRRDLAQCERGRGLGFVVHGLWPQNEHGYPTECEPPHSPSRSALEEARGIYPDASLARHQWRRHGTCSGKSPAEYFRDVRRAWERVRIPESLERFATDRVATSFEVERAFAQANPGLRPDMMAVACRRGMLQEVRICLDRDLRGFRRCPEVDRRGCGFGEIRIETGR